MGFRRRTVRVVQQSGVEISQHQRGHQAERLHPRGPLVIPGF